MKKNLLIIAILLALFIPTKAQWVTIPDSNFVNFLTQNYPSCMNGNMMDTTCNESLTEDSISITSIPIANFEGIQYFDSLKYLKLVNTSTISLPQLPGSLKFFTCRNNPLSTFPFLPTTIEILNCSDNELTSIPDLPVSLKELDCSGNFLTNLPSLPNGLKILNCSAIVQLNTLPNLPDSLISLNCISSQLTNLPSLPAGLQFLYCSFCNLTNLPSLPNSLIILTCSYNVITNLPTLPDSLLFLNCEFNQLTNLPAIPSTLLELTCFTNLLTDIPLVPYQMNGFRVDQNNISCLTNLPLTNNGDISNNPLTCIPNQTSYSLGLPLCIDNDLINNPNNCISTVNISGYIFSDQNTDCTYNTNDMGSSNIPINLYDSLNNLIAQNYAINGIYGFSINQSGMYKVKLQNNNIPISMACALADSQLVNLVSTSNGISNLNFPVQCNMGYDVYPLSAATQSWVSSGQIHTLITNVSSNEAWYNISCDTINYSGTVSINITGSVNYVAPANNALTPIVNGNTFTYNITDFSALTPASFGLELITDTTAQSNDQICVHIEINPTPIDADTANNSYDYCYQVLNSYDPNMKEVYPVNVLPGYDDWFTYTIHFQNTGNAPAFNIRLRDTLDANLDINTFEVRGYSHPAIVSINGNILTVRFNNIMLPDSTTDYEGSMGYFQYRIKPLPNLPLGTQIENTAYIYFDYNTPIVTNTTLNNFQTLMSTFNQNNDVNQLKVFPNPANEMLSISLVNGTIENCIILNALGQTVYKSANEINANHKIQLNISNLSTGVYFVKVRSGTGSYTTKFIKVE